MKTIIITLIILIILGGAIYYFTASKDKCADITCPAGKECNSNTGKCEINSMNKIEQAIDNSLQSNSGMDRIESAINKKLKE